MDRQLCRDQCEKGVNKYIPLTVQTNGQWFICRTNLVKTDDFASPLSPMTETLLSYKST